MGWSPLYGSCPCRLVHSTAYSWVTNFRPSGHFPSFIFNVTPRSVNSFPPFPGADCSLNITSSFRSTDEVRLQSLPVIRSGDALSAVLSADEFLYVVRYLVTFAAETYLLSCRLIDDKKG